MAAVTSAIVGAIGVGLTAVGTITGMKAASDQAEASERAEQLRKKQMRLDAQKERRQIVRQAIMARANTVAAGVAQGAQDGSAVAGGIGQIMGEANRGIAFNRTSEGIGAGIFDANAAHARAGGMQALGQGMTAFGGMMIDNAPKLGRLGTYYSQRPS